MSLANQKNIHLKFDDMFITKTGANAIEDIVKHKKKIAKDIGISSEKVIKWKKKLVAIDCLCDPVHRLLSEFLHVKATHRQRKDKPNRKLVKNF